MDWIPLATRLGLHIALGYLLSLLFLGPAPVGKFFYQMTGWTAAIAAGLAGLLALSQGWPEQTMEQWRVAATLGTVVPAYWYISNKPKVRRRALIVACLSGIGALAAQAFGPHGLGSLQLAGDLAGSAVAGGVCFAMVFGHGYLTVPNLPFSHLVRINTFTAVVLALRLLLSATALALAWSRLTGGYRPELTTFDWLDLMVRFGVGLFLPLLFAWMVHSSLRYRNNQSATGILYASTVLVWIGEAVALHLGGRWEVAL
ncbi:MAG: hypothetical protein DWQ01_10495 [Planctomycetota bacterium]|nr:MAG: hypothetical protein DWQ01_10495 [Planctomycetota bacterium]